MSATVAAQFSRHLITASPERGFLVALLRDVKLAARSKGEVIQALVFFVVVVSLFSAGDRP